MPLGSFFARRLAVHEGFWAPQFHNYDFGVFKISNDPDIHLAQAEHTTRLGEVLSGLQILEKRLWLRSP